MDNLKIKKIVKNFIFSYAAIHTVAAFIMFDYKIGLKLLIASLIFAFGVIILPLIIESLFTKKDNTLTK